MKKLEEALRAAYPQLVLGRCSNDTLLRLYTDRELPNKDSLRVYVQIEKRAFYRARVNLENDTGSLSLLLLDDNSAEQILFATLATLDALNLGPSLPPKKGS